MDIYNLINSKAISEHCRKVQHHFNTEKLAGLNNEDIKRVKR